MLATYFGTNQCGFVGNKHLPYIEWRLRQFLSVLAQNILTPPVGSRVVRWFCFYNLDDSRARAYCACSRCGWGCLDILTLLYFYTPPHVSGGVLCFHVDRPCVCPSIVRPSIRTSFPFDTLNMSERISLKFCICNCTNNVLLHEQISIIHHIVMALVNVQKMVFGL